MMPVTFGEPVKKAKSFHHSPVAFSDEDDDDDGAEPMVHRSATLAEKRAIYSHTRALLAKIRFQRPLGDDQEDATSPAAGTSLSQGPVEAQHVKAKNNWTKLREFVTSSKKVRRTHDVMQIWLQVHEENTQRKLLEALTEFLQSEALRKAEAAEAAELFRAAEAAAAAAAAEKAQAEEKARAEREKREKKEIFDIHAFSKQAADMMESLAAMQQEQDQLLREVAELQESMNLSQRRAGRLVAKIQESEMADTVNEIRRLAADIPEDEDDEDGLEEEEEEEEEAEEEEEPADLPLVRRDRATKTLGAPAPAVPAPEPGPAATEKIITFEEQREALIEKVVEIELLLLKSRKMQITQESFAQEMKDNLCPLLPRMRPRCSLGHLMNEAPGRYPSVRSEDACCSCNRAPRSGSKSKQTQSVDQASLPGAPEAGHAAKAPATTHWVCQDCLFQSHIASWMCENCSLEHQTLEMARVASSLEGKAERSHETELEAIIETIDASLRAEARRRLRLRHQLLEIKDLEIAVTKRPQFVRKEKPKLPRQVARRHSQQRESLIMKSIDLAKFLVPAEKESPKEIVPVEPPSQPAELGCGVTKITIEGVVLERALGIQPEKEIISSVPVRNRRNQLALEASAIAKRLATEAESQSTGSRWTEMRPGSTSLQHRVEQATLVAWKERVDSAEQPCPGGIPDALRSPSPRPMISPVERFSPSPLDSPRARRCVRSRPFEISTLPNAERLSFRPWRQERPERADVFDSFQEVQPALRPNTAPGKVSSVKAGTKMRSVEQWLKVLMPKVAQDSAEPPR